MKGRYPTREQHEVGENYLTKTLPPGSRETRANGACGLRGRPVQSAIVAERDEEGNARFAVPHMKGEGLSVFPSTREIESVNSGPIAPPCLSMASS